MLARSWNLFKTTAPLRRLFIRTEETPNVNSLKFITGHRVMGEGVKEFNTVDDTATSPLAKDLMHIDGVRSVFYGPEFITVTKDERFAWIQLKASIFAAIMDQYNIRGEQLFVAGPGESGQQPQPSEMPTDASAETVDAITKIIDTRIRPVVQQDGGDVEYRGFVKGYVRLRMQGACKSCASSAITLRNGIENMLMHYIPEVRGVEQVQDDVDRVSIQEFQKVQGKYPRDDDSGGDEGDGGDGGDDHDGHSHGGHGKDTDNLLDTIKPKPRPEPKS